MNKMANTINVLKPSVCYEVQKIIGISASEGSCKSYQVQWAPSWISGAHLVGCDDLIEQFEHEQRREDIKIEEIDANHSQYICGLADRKNNDKVVMQDDNLHEDSALKQEIIKDIEDNIHININSSSSQSHCNKSNINLKVSSLNSIIQNITRSNNERSVGRNTVHPDFQGVKTKISNISNDRSPPSNVQVDDKRQEADASSESVEAMVIVKEAMDNGQTESSQLKAVQYFCGGNRDLAIPNDSFGKSVIKATSKKKRDLNADILIEGGQSSSYSKSKQGKKSLETKVNAMKTFGCNICNKVFSNDLALKNHSKLHRGIHQCATCCKTFTVKAKLQKHELVHSTGKEFSCSFCKERFTDMDELLLHIQVHKTVKGNPLECPYCPKRFLTKTHVKVHTRVHTGECPFKCIVCQRRFNVKHNLQRHFKTHHVKKGL